MTLIEAVKESKNENEFLFKIKTGDNLLNELHQWEKENALRLAKYKYCGWFTIAADYWKENH